jgi:hypothetical protein
MMRGPNVVRWATAELQAIRCDLAMSLGGWPRRSRLWAS